MCLCIFFAKETINFVRKTKLPKFSFGFKRHTDYTPLYVYPLFYLSSAPEIQRCFSSVWLIPGIMSVVWAVVFWLWYMVCWWSDTLTHLSAGRKEKSNSSGAGRWRKKSYFMRSDTKDTKKWMGSLNKIIRKAVWCYHAWTEIFWKQQGFGGGKTEWVSQLFEIISYYKNHD